MVEKNLPLTFATEHLQQAYYGADAPG